MQMRSKSAQNVVDGTSRPATVTADEDEDVHVLFLRMGVRILTLYYEYLSNDDGNGNGKDSDSNGNSNYNSTRIKYEDVKKLCDYFMARIEIGNENDKSVAEGGRNVEIGWIDSELLDLFILLVNDSVNYSDTSTSSIGSDQRDKKSDLDKNKTLTEKSVSVPRLFHQCWSKIPHAIMIRLDQCTNNGKHTDTNMNIDIDMDMDKGKSEKQTDGTSQKKKKNTEPQQQSNSNDGAMVKIFQTLLNGTYESSKSARAKAITCPSPSPSELFYDPAAQFLSLHASILQSHGRRWMEIEMEAGSSRKVGLGLGLGLDLDLLILSDAFIVNATRILLAKNGMGDSRRLFSHNAGGDANVDANEDANSSSPRILLHYSIVTYLSWHLSSLMWTGARKPSSTSSSSPSSSLFNIVRELQKNPCGKLSIALQKLIILGLSSVVDRQSAAAGNSSSSSNSNKSSRSDVSSMEMYISMIRTVTLSVLTGLTNQIANSGNDNGNGISWLRSPPNSGSNDEASSFCTILSLVAGEQRIALGRLLDTALWYKDPDNVDKHAIKANENISNKEGWLEMSQGCCKVGLMALKWMMELANDDGDGIRSSNTQKAGIPFNPDAILHMRRSLEDILDSSIQFLLEDTSDEVFVSWGDCKYDCCRYLGAYLSAVDIFDYDDGEIVKDEEASDMKRTTSSVNILCATRNGIQFCEDHDKFNPQNPENSNGRIHSSRALALFPCIVATLSCCENARHVTLVRQFLLRDAVLSSALENLLKLSHFYITKYSIILSESITWFCVMVDSLLEFQTIARTLGANGSCYVLNTSNTLKLLRPLISSLWRKLEHRSLSHCREEDRDLLEGCYNMFISLSGSNEENSGNEVDVVELTAIRSWLDR